MLLSTFRVLEQSLRATRVDRERRVIRRVKVLGADSNNGRKYTPEAINAAVKLYEGAPVRVDHPRKATDQRESDDVFGWLENATSDGESIYADLHYLEAHPLAERVLEAAERNPRLFGLSHNADGKGEQKNGVLVIHEIVEVRSVDLVADPATTHGLFESTIRKREVRRMKLRAFFESIRGLSKPARRRITRLFEEELIPPDAEMMAPPGGDDMPPPPPPPADTAPPPASSSPEDLLRQGFRAACHAILDDDTLDLKAKLARMKEVLTAEEKLIASGEVDGSQTEESPPPPADDDDMSEEPTEESDDGDYDDDDGKDKDMELEECEDEDHKMKESTNLQLRRRVRELEAREATRELCESHGVQPTKLLIKALVGLSSTEDRKAFLLESKRATSQSQGRKPRTTNLTESTTGGSSSNPRYADSSEVVNTRELDRAGFLNALRTGKFIAKNESEVI